RPEEPLIDIVALLETPRGIAEAYNIAEAHECVVAIALGAEDYTATLGANRTKEGTEIFTARTMIINAAAAADIQAIDTPFTDANDDDGLTKDTILAKQLGFKGKLAINPRQIDVIHTVFNPSQADIDWAEQVIFAIRQAERAGSGVASLHGKMVDAPIVNRAERILHLARLLRLVKED
ncbi:MAG: HpcH/HpaI aldolase/citrate lyase family protein, partial [Pelosinus sp.]|nr:HpcH/HpaI aldolase/citrate lyase family protein [Pelosinus sp.]